jgi:hypothetical protein
MEINTDNQIARALTSMGYRKDSDKLNLWYKQIGHGIAVFNTELNKFYCYFSARNPKDSDSGVQCWKSIDYVYDPTWDRPEQQQLVWFLAESEAYSRWDINVTTVKSFACLSPEEATHLLFEEL